MVVVTTAPTAAYPPGGYPPPQTVVYGTAQPVYGAPVTTTTTVYSHSSSHAAPVVVAQSKADADKKGKKKRMVCLFVCLFVAALVLCLTLVPWPGSRYIDLYPNEQTTVFANGLFILTTEVTTNAGDQPVEVRGYRDAPSQAWVSYGPLEETFVPGYNIRTNQVNTFVNYDTYAYITVPASSAECANTYFYVYAFAGKSRYDDFVNNGYTGFARTWTFLVGSGLPRVEYNINDRDVYYFVLYNPVCASATTALTLSVDFRSYRYPIGSPQFTCTTGNCIDEVPYGEFRYYVAEVPYLSDTTATYRSEIALIGNSGAYIGLYVGLFGTMILCGVVALVASKKKEREAEDAENGDRNPLLGQVCELSGRYGRYSRYGRYRRYGR